MTERQGKAGPPAAATTTEATSIIDDILSETQLKPTDEGYDVTRKGIQAFLTELLAPAPSHPEQDREMPQRR